MTDHQIMLVGAVVALFAFIICAVQLIWNESVHWLWLLLLLAGLVAFVIGASG